MTLGAAPVPVVVGFDLGEGGVGVGQAAVEFEGAKGGGAGLGRAFRRGRRSIVAEEGIGVGEAGISTGVAGVCGDSVLEMEDGGGDAGAGTFVPMEPADEILAIGLLARSVGAREGLAQFGLKAPDERAGDFPAQLPDDRLQLAGLAFVTRAPDLGRVGDGEQFRGDDEPPAARREAAQQDRVRTQTLHGGWQAGGGQVRAAHHGVRQHPEVRACGSGKAARQVFRDAVRERLQRWFGVYIDKRENSERDFAGIDPPGNQNPRGARQDYKQCGNQSNAVPPSGPGKLRRHRLPAWFHGLLTCLRGCFRAAALHPGVEFIRKRVHRAALPMGLPADVEALFLLPADDSPDASPQVSRDFLP